MFRHVVMFKWAEGTTSDQVQAIVAELRKLPGMIDSLRDYRVGPDAGINPGNFDFVAVADFEDRDGYLAYRDHPVHRAVVKEYITPVAADRAAVQFEC